MSQRYTTSICSLNGLNDKESELAHMAFLQIMDYATVALASVDPSVAFTLKMETDADSGSDNSRNTFYTCSIRNIEDAGLAYDVFKQIQCVADGFLEDVDTRVTITMKMESPLVLKKDVRVTLAYYQGVYETLFYTSLGFAIVFATSDVFTGGLVGPYLSKLGEKITKALS